MASSFRCVLLVAVGVASCVLSGAAAQSCRPCTAADGAQCTHPGNANQEWCDGNCPDGANGAGCPASHCFCGGPGVPRVCHPCTALDPGCTHPGNADQEFCDARCLLQVNDAVCVASHCFCPPFSAPRTERMRITTTTNTVDRAQRVFGVQAIDRFMQGADVSAVARHMARYPIGVVSMAAGAFLTLFVVAGVAWRRARRSSFSSHNSNSNTLSKRGSPPKAGAKPGPASAEGSPNPSSAASNTSPVSSFVRRRPPVSP